MTDTQKLISTLGMPEKVTLFKELYSELSGYGIEGDTELAHVNTFEVSLLKSFGGSGTINEVTGLREYKGGGGSPPPPQPASSQTVSQTSEFPTEIKPFIKDILKEGKGEFQREKEEGYLRFPGSQLAGFTPEQQAVFDTGRQQFTGLAGTPLGQASTYYTPALAATALGTSEIGTGDIARRMDPFIQNVVDVAKREAGRDEELARQQRAAQAVGAGSFGGSRQAILEAEGERNLAERLGDIQARGLSTAFQNAQRAAEQQRAREMTGGRQFAALGDITGTRARSDLAGLSGIGEVQQQRQQQALDIARREFEQEKAFPQTALQRYASLIRGFPLAPNQQQVTTTRERPPSFASQLTAAGLGAAGTYGMFGGFNPTPTASAAGGLVGLANGGVVGAKGGGLPKPVSSSTAQPQASQGTLPTGGGKAGGNNFLRLLMTNPEIAKQLKDKFGLTIDSSGNWSRAASQVAQQTQQPFANINLGNYVKTKNDGGLLSVVKARVGRTLSLSEHLDPSYKIIESPDLTLEDLENIQSGEVITGREGGWDVDNPEVPKVVPEVSTDDLPPTPYDEVMAKQLELLNRLSGERTTLRGQVDETENLINELLKDSPRKTKGDEQKEIRDFYLEEQRLAEENKKKIGERYGQSLAMAAWSAAPHFLEPGKTWGEQAISAKESALPRIEQAQADKYAAEDLSTEAARDRRLAQRGEEKLVDDLIWENRLKRIDLNRAKTTDKLKLAALDKEEAAIHLEMAKYEQQLKLAYGLGNIELGSTSSLVADAEGGIYGDIVKAMDKVLIYSIVQEAKENIMQKYSRPDAPPIVTPEQTILEVEQEVQRLLAREVRRQKQDESGNTDKPKDNKHGGAPLSPTAIEALNTQLD
jgi:hypothetical protein